MRNHDLSLVTARTDLSLDAMPSAPMVGSVVSALRGQAPRVRFAGSPDDGVVARSCVALQASDAGKAVVLLFEGNDPARPLVMGVLHDPADEVAAKAVNVAPGQDELRLSAQRQIVLECGEASLTLTQAGKVLIKGAYVLSHSTGTNRLRGGSVEIN